MCSVWWAQCSVIYGDVMLVQIATMFAITPAISGAEIGNSIVFTLILQKLQVNSL